MMKFNRTASVMLFFCTSVIPARGDVETPAMATMQRRLGNVAFTNLPMSEAINLVRTKAGVPLNVFVDSESEPVVSISRFDSTLKDVISEILQQAGNYDVLPSETAILIAPRNLTGNASFPLNRPLPKFGITFTKLETKRGELFSCAFDLEAAASLNTSLPPVLLETRPNCETFPAARTYNGESLLNILTALSEEFKISWSCGRLLPSYVKQRNKEWSDQRLGPTWWPNEAAPAYSVVWGRAAFHGTAPKFNESLSTQFSNRWERLAMLNRAMTEGLKNRTNCPVRLNVGIGSETDTGSSNIWLTIELTNIGTKRLTITNPFSEDFSRGFFRIVRTIQDTDRLGGYGAYDLQPTLPKGSKESAEISLGPQETYVRRLNIRGAPMILDELTADTNFKGSKVECLGKTDRYTLAISVYFRDQNGISYYLGPTAIDFEIDAGSRIGVR